MQQSYCPFPVQYPHTNFLDPPPQKVPRSKKGEKLQKAAAAAAATAVAVVAMANCMHVLLAAIFYRFEQKPHKRCGHC